MDGGGSGAACWGCGGLGCSVDGEQVGERWRMSGSVIKRGRGGKSVILGRAILLFVLVK